MSDAIRLLIYNLDADRREATAEAASAEAASAEPGGWNPYLGTRATSEQRADRATRLREASRDRERAA